MDGRRAGALVGAVGGLAFVLVNAGALPAAGLVRVAGVVAFVVVAAVALGRPLGTSTPPDRRAVRTYGWSVLAMVVGIVGGARVLDASGHADLVPVWVVAVVGLHFVPFARAFSQPLFRRLAAAMVGVALAGALGSLLGVADAVAWAAVAGGAALLAAAASPGR